MKNTIQQPLKQKWTDPTDNSGKLPSMQRVNTSKRHAQKVFDAVDQIRSLLQMKMLLQRNLHVCT